VPVPGPLCSSPHKVCPRASLRRELAVLELSVRVAVLTAAVVGPTGLFMKSDELQIDEHVGNVATGTSGVSLAHVRTRGPCDEHAQVPGFDEFVLVLKGKMVVDVGPVGKTQTQVEAVEGETLWLPKGVRYHYHFPAPEGTEYIPICFPAFAPEIAGREEDSAGAN
jgi:mannose-6-phosphate isomerase-like protein (cupin superfamily)